MTMASHYVTVLERELHYVEWGAGNGENVVMWHGLARTGRDFDDLAAALSRRYRVICPDTLGRGLSQWSPEPDREYCLAFYARLAAAFCDALGVARMHWVGTSMGGAIGIKLASRNGGALAGRIDKLVLNDNGPQLAQAAIERIRNYAANPPAFARVSELDAYFRKVYAPYGMLTDREWVKLTETSAGACPTAASRRITIQTWCGSSSIFHTTMICGRSTTRSTFRSCACAARIRTCCWPRPRRQCASAAPGRAWWRSPVAVMPRRSTCRGRSDWWRSFSPPD